MREEDPTIAPGVTRRTPALHAVPPPAGRFTPGAIVAGRYRLVALLGRGGMGEVYRADDLTLDQPVALKFLAEGVAADAERLAQFHNELRIARQVSHRNVVRLYDLGEADGRRFLTMEYVDGEDLASLLRRIGRFPEDRAVAIARQLCAGVAAAHERGVVHRDLKPANVMIDGDGNVRITDFGIATAAADAAGALAGTPQYMAPEQLTGTGASIKTDLYALGLILFEVFTGKRAHDAKTINELKALHDTGTITTPSSLVRDLDPAVERIILRCLDRNPDHRPASALAVAAALPGGDPLAEALAAGETPSPDVLVAAAETDAMPVLHALVCLGVLLISTVIYIAVSPRVTMAGLVPLEKPAAVLTDRARQILASFGYRERPADTASAFRVAPDFPRWLIATDETTRRWDPARVAVGPAVVYWYRTSPRDLDPLGLLPNVSSTDPPLTDSDMSLVILDTRGRLLEFHHVPPQRDTKAEGAPPAPDWSAAFRAAELQEDTFTRVAPEWTPRDFADTRAAWEGPSADDGNIRLRVEAAAYRGRLVSFYVVGPWTRPAQMQPLTLSPLKRILTTVSVTIGLLVLGGAALIARHNARTNRADRRTAARLAVLCLVLHFGGWIVGGHHTATAAIEINNFYAIVMSAIFRAALLWILYLAIEPYGRRFWPDGLLGWTRLFSGRLRDPRIGREILIGCALGGVLMLIDLARAVAPYAIGRPPGLPALGQDVGGLSSLTRLFITWDSQFYGGVQSTLIITMVVVVLRLIVRRTWIAVAIALVAVSMMASQNMPPGGVPWIDAIMQVIAIGVLMFSIFRFGLLVTAVLFLVDNLPTAVPVTSESWASAPFYLSMLVVSALACFGFYAARAGQPLFGKLEV